jgi:hypothetical protein
VTRDALGLRPGAEVDFDPDGETVRIMAAGDTPLGAAPLRWDSPVMGGALPAAGQWTSSHPGAVRRLSGCAALVVAAVALRGTLGVLLGIVALLLLLDAVVPMPPGTRSQADDRFRALVRRRRRARRAGRVRRRPPERLEVLDDASGDIAAAERSALGVQLIAIGSITGTVEELKARAFDREFRPEAASSEHWKRLWLAQAHGATLPPISVYRVGDRHVVRDGHHRISVARDHGLLTIEADVVELRAAARRCSA